MRTEPGPTPAVGQVWADNDKRSAGREIIIESISDGFAFVRLVNQRGRPAKGHEAQQQAKPGRPSRIALQRLRPTATGYMFVR